MELKKVSTQVPVKLQSSILDFSHTTCYCPQRI